MIEQFTLWQRFCMWFCHTFADWYLERQYSRGWANHSNGYTFAYRGEPVKRPPPTLTERTTGGASLGDRFMLGGNQYAVLSIDYSTDGRDTLTAWCFERADPQQEEN